MLGVSRGLCAVDCGAQRVGGHALQESVLSKPKLAQKLIRRIKHRRAPATGVDYDTLRSRQPVYYELRYHVMTG